MFVKHIFLNIVCHKKKLNYADLFNQFETNKKKISNLHSPAFASPKSPTHRQNNGSWTLNSTSCTYWYSYYVKQRDRNTSTEHEFAQQKSPIVLKNKSFTSKRHSRAKENFLCLVKISRCLYLMWKTLKSNYKDGLIIHSTSIISDKVTFFSLSTFSSMAKRYKISHLNFEKSVPFSLNEVVILE